MQVYDVAGKVAGSGEYILGADATGSHACYLIYGVLAAGRPYIAAVEPATPAAGDPRDSWVHPSRELRYASVGRVCELHPAILDRYGIRATVAVVVSGIAAGHSRTRDGGSGAARSGRRPPSAKAQTARLLASATNCRPSCS